MSNITSHLCIALAAVGVGVALPLDRAGQPKQVDGNGQADTTKQIVTALLLALAALLALYIYLAWKRREPAPPPFLFVAPQPLSPNGDPTIAVPSRHRPFPQSMSMGFAASSSSSGPASSPPIQVPVMVLKAKTKINAPAVGDHYMNK